ncbi:sensor histidine kinase [Nocardiopsis alba]|uniref:sensor histidine kinase n=1 Tax=Nocardiopsis alba TaxID=53437 RepID=UPI0033F4A439
MERSRRDLSVDVLLTVFVLVCGLLAFSAYGNDLHPTDRVPTWVLWADLSCLPPACVALWWRRSHPLAVATGIILVSSFSVAVIGALIVCLISLAIHRPPLMAIGAATLATVLSLPWALLVPVTPGAVGVTMVAIVIMLNACVAWGAAIRSQRRLVERLREDVRREREIREERLGLARVEERRRIAREMHDVVAHRMSLLSVHAGALAYRTERAESGRGEPPTPAEVGAAVRVIRDNAHRVLDELGDILDVLRSGDLAGEEGGTPQPRLTDLPRLVEEAVDAGERVHASFDLPEDAEPRDQVQRTAYRVVQEGLTNVRKHAPGARTTVEVSGAPGRALEIVVVNALPVGRAGREVPGTGAGLAGLSERVRLDGGSLEYGPEEGRFRLVVVLPWPEEGADASRRNDHRKVP